ncbi:hypothetical protein [Rubrivirga sp. IMCC43871]|uniref:hypothetical protein n=1 Tax=Rubrivirga sp. IMCC43871 TaxID=3391575 RepID=UPI0039900AB1
MRISPGRLASLALLVALLLASAPTADAQLRGLANRARAAISDAVPTPTATLNARVDYARLLSTRFYPARGTFYFNSSSATGGGPRGDDQIIFPPSSISAYDEIGHYVVRRQGGGTVARQTITHGGFAGSDAFIVVNTSGGPEWRGALEDGGSYSFDIELRGEVIGTVPFSARVIQSGDPFDPAPTMVLDGPWRTHAYFEHETERPEYLMHFHAWVGPDEVEGVTANSEISIRRGGQEVAWGHGFINTTHGWGPIEYDLFDAGTRDTRHGFGRAVVNAARWEIGDVMPGDYEIVFSTEAGPFRTMHIEGADGAFVPHPRSAMGHQPRSTYLSPRRMAGRNSSYDPMSVYWIAPAE